MSPKKKKKGNHKNSGRTSSCADSHLWDQLNKLETQNRFSTWFPETTQPNGNTDPRKLGGDIVGPGGPKDTGAVLLDMTDCILLGDIAVSTVDAVKDDQRSGPLVYMTMSGRINKKNEDAQVGFVFDTDGAAAIITELLALTTRFGTEMLIPLIERLVQLETDKNVSIMWLRAALDLAQETVKEAEADGP